MRAAVHRVVFKPRYTRYTLICWGSVCWSSLRLSGCPVRARAKNSSWCTGWESQQQRRKLRPESQISSASAAVLVWPDASAGPVSGFEAERQLCAYLTVHLRVTLVVTRQLWINTTELGGDVFAVFKAHSDNCYYLISAFVWKPPLGAGMPSLLSMGAVYPAIIAFGSDTDTIGWVQGTRGRWKHSYLSSVFEIRHTVE